jgi:hypothetical protein
MRFNPNSTGFWFVAIAALLATCSTRIAVSEEQNLPEIKSNTVWAGTCNENISPDYRMVLFVRSRSGDRIEGTNWYPSLDNALVSYTGQINTDGTISFTEEKVIHKGNAIAAGHWTATLKGKSLSGSYKVVLSPLKVDGGKFSLKLAE